MYKVAVKNTATNKIVSYSFKKVERFYNYKSIYPELYKEMNICLKDTKSFVNCIKTQQKACSKLGLSYFLIQVTKGSKETKVITCKEMCDTDEDYKFSEFSFELKESAEFSGNYFYVFDKILKCLDDWNGNLCFDKTELSFGMKAVDTCFCMSVYDTNKFFDKYSIVVIKPDKLTKIKGVPPIQSEKESSLNDKERSKAKETKPTMQYTDDMLELVSLDLNSMTYTVNGDVGTEKDIASIVLYDKIGKIVVYCDDGEKIECQFDGESVLQSVINEISGNFK